jgi:hypothetical protein
MERKYAAAMRATESIAYHGNASGEREISGPAMTAGTWKA